MEGIDGCLLCCDSVLQAYQYYFVKLEISAECDWCNIISYYDVYGSGSKFLPQVSWEHGNPETIGVLELSAQLQQP